MFESGALVTLLLFIFAIYIILKQVFHVDLLEMLP
jgi:hypothetical protein